MSFGIAALRRCLGLGLGLTVLAVPAAFVACTSEVTSAGEPPEPEPDPSPSGSATTTPTATGTSTGEKPPPSTPDAGVDAAPSSVTLQVSNATYRNTTAAGGGFVYSIDFLIDNTSSKDVVSLDSMVFDLGGANQVSLKSSPCKGSFPIAAGSKKKVETQVVVSDAGSVTNFSFICPGSQQFGGATGKAPATASFADPIAVKVGGKTSDGTFAASGSATRSN